MTAQHRLLLAFCSALLLGWGPNVSAQEPSLSPPAKRHYEHSGVIRSVYQPANDRTIVALQPYPIDEEINVYQPRHQLIRIMAGFNFPGRIMTLPATVIEFAIIADTASAPRFQKGSLELTAVVDGELIFLSKLRFKRPSDGPMFFHLGSDDIACGTCKVYHEELLADFNYQGLLRIINAKKVELRAGRVKLNVDKDLREALRDLASRALP